MKSTLFNKLIPGANVVALIGAALVAFPDLSLNVKSSEIVIASIAAATAALAGLSSVYIARAAKSLPRTRRIFISYSRGEKDRARELRDVLERHGAKVWFDENELQPGSDLKSSIAAAIESSNTVVAVVSNSIGTHLYAELKAALDRHVPVFAIFTDDAPQSDLLRSDKNVTILEQGQSLEQVASTVLATH